MSENETDLEKAWEYFTRIRDALNGLYEILTINLDANNIFFKCGVDNLENLKETILDLLKKDYNKAEVTKKLRELEFDMKKCLFFEKEEAFE